MLTRKITEGKEKRNTRTKTDFRRLNKLKRKEDIKFVKISAEED